MARQKSMEKESRKSSTLVNLLLLFICLAWTVPTLGLMVSSFRDRADIQSSGWWSVLPHRGWVETGDEIAIPPDQTRDAPITIEGVTATYDKWREGVNVTPSRRLTWIGNLRTGRLMVSEKKWTANWLFSLDNYRQSLGGKTFEVRDSAGNVTTVQGDNFVRAFLNSLTVTVPATIIPILIAAFAAYGFAWMKFPGRKILFIGVVALLVVPLQAAIVPILQTYEKIQLNGTFLGIWLAHTGFGLPLATYLLYNYISTIPRDMLESAFIDGASHFTIFIKLIIPLSVPALASFAIFQFLWVWNDYLISLIFIGITSRDMAVLTMRIADMLGSRGQDWHLLTSSAFISMVVPLLVFFGLQRYFVRGMMAGSVKG